MNILILSSPHPFKIAGVVALDIYKGLKEIEGNEVKMVVKVWDNYPEKDIIPIDTFYGDIKARIIRKLQKELLKYEILKETPLVTNPDYQVLDYDLSVNYYSTNKILKKAKIRPDVIIVLFMLNYISYKNLYELNVRTGAKIFLFPMDMAPFTGGCHYAWDCERYTQQCGKCPALYSTDSKDQSFKNLSFNKDLIEKTNVSLFACNLQIADQIRKSSIFKGKEVTDGIYPVPDETVFYSRDKKAARDYFKIEKDKKVFFFGSYSLVHKRKGMIVLLDALKIVSEELNNKHYDTSKILLLVAGLNYEQIAKNIPFESKYIGFIQDYNELALAYSAADFYISPSLEDTGPTMVLQSMMCKTPVIAFNIGYANEFIQDKVNGFVAHERNSNTLADCIINAIQLSLDSYLLFCLKLVDVKRKVNKNEVIHKIIKAINII